MTIKAENQAMNDASKSSDAAFNAALKIILHHEGGYVNDKRDRGGMTNLGVTRDTWEHWTGCPSNEARMRALTVADVTPLYRKRYWDAVHGDDMPGPVALCLFDMAVNAGPSRAAKILQKAVGVPDDGHIGPKTIAAVRGWSVHSLVEAYQDKRRAFYRSLATFPTFGKGWLRRVDEVEATALGLAG